MRAEVPSRRAASEMRMATILTISCQESRSRRALALRGPVAWSQTRISSKAKQKPTRRLHVRGAPGRRPVAGRLRPQGDPAGQTRDAGAHGDPRRVRPQPAATRGEDHRLPAYD